MIVRNKPSKNFTVLRNAVLERNDLSLKAKGLWAFLMSKPDGWQTTIRGIETQLKEGKDAISGALKELEKVGLYRRIRDRDDNGQFSWQDFVYDEPCPDNQDLDNQDLDNPLQVNTNRVKTEQVNTDKTVAKATATKRRDDIDRMFAYWSEATGIPITANIKRNRYACANLLKRYAEDDLRRLIDGAATALGDQYAPRIADLATLQVKIPDLLAWGRKRQSSNRIAIIN